LSQYQLAQLNLAKAKFPLDSKALRGFTDNLDRINLLAENSLGFIWRLQTEDGDATGIDHFGADTIVNMSVWQDIESLHNYVYRSAHIEVMSRRKEWFHRFESVYAVLWWVELGHLPSLEESEQRLASLASKGPTSCAFTFKQSFPPPDL
jgi:hypothetical protein